MTDLHSIARELYALTPDRFVAERNTRAKALRSGGERLLADAVRALPKASAAAWAVGLLAREKGAEFEAVLELGRTLRQAQEDLDPDALRSLGRQRRQLVSAMAREAETLARRDGHRLGPSVLIEVEQTIQAALADPDAAAATTSGRLVRSLVAEGLDAADLAGALGGGEDAGPQVEEDDERGTGTGTLSSLAEARAEKARRQADREERRRRDRAEADAAVAEAEAAVSAAEDRRRRADRRSRDTTEDRRRMEEEVAALRARLERLETELASTTEEARIAEDDLAAASRERDRSAGALEAALRRARDLT
jgi:hypothetical protein